jgi:hypothetical protein
MHNLFLELSAGRSICLAIALSLLPTLSFAESCAVATDSKKPIENTRVVRLDFSGEDTIDKHDPADNKHRPLYFNLRSSSNPSCLGTVHRYTIDTGTDFSTWLDERVPSRSLESDRSLAVRITSTLNQNVKDKVLFSVVAHNDENHISLLRPQNERYVSFSFMLDPSYELPHNWALHFQAWQCCGGHPPFAIRVIPGRDTRGPVEFNFIVSNDEIEGRGDQPQSIYKMKVARGEWHNMVLKLKPRPVTSSEPGEIAMWFDLQQKLSWSGHWGYTPTANSLATAGVAKDSLGVELGVYRRRQSTTQTILFDNVRFADSFNEVADAPCCGSDKHRDEHQ